MVSQTLVIAGPTGSGKSDYALKLAQEIDGEIVCADSRQIYQKMPIATNCPSSKDYRLVPHHGFEKLDPRENYTAGQFILDTDNYIREIQARNKTPILVGGTGLYLRAWRLGLDANPPASQAIRAELEGQNLPNLYAKLQAVDPKSAAQIKPEDSVRIHRALEIFELTGKKPSELRQTDLKQKPRVEARWLLVSRFNWIPGQARDDKIDAQDNALFFRAKHMFEFGLIEEALALREYLAGDDPHERLKTPGVLEALEYADSQITLEQAIEKTYIRHRQYAKRQRTWFKKEPWWEIISI